MKNHLQLSQTPIQLRLRRTSLHPLFLLLSLIFFLLSSSPFAEIRYVSKTGSSTPPYTSWATASDSIQKCINISGFGDTIYVANGVYKEQVVMIPGLSLIGAGMDSCVIDTRELNSSSEFQAIIMADSCSITQFHLLVSYNKEGIGILPNNILVKIESVKISNARTGIWLINTSSTISNCFILNMRGRGVRLEAFTFDYYSIVEKNLITTEGFGVFVSFGSSPIIRHNIIYLMDNAATGYNGGGSDSVWIYNNVVILEEEYSYNLTDGFANTGVPTRIFNNIVIGRVGIAYIIRENNIAENNIAINSEVGFYRGAGSNIEIKYNNSWNNDINYSSFTPDSTNLSVNPMFVNDTSDFHLQMFSPLIDAGDPNILDKDGSRSDIGLYGGPNGEKYTYRDLAPKPPSNLTAQYDSGLVKLTWNRNTEADFFHYRVYRDTVPDFMYDTTKIIAVLPDTVYYDELPEIYLPGNYYYKVTALDSTGHQSAPGEEVHINITGVPEGPPVVVEHYQLLNNYPNPFNPSTIIPYRLKEPGYVKLYIYDIKGELVRILVNEYQDRGYYEVEFRPSAGERKQVETGEEYWTGYNDDIASGMYIYQLMVKGEGNIPVFTGMGKMILLK